MNLREAAQQALEALDSDNPDIQLRAAILLRAALEQPVQPPCDIAEDGVCEALECCKQQERA